MQTVKSFLGLVGLTALAAVTMLLVVSTHNRRAFPAQRAAHESLQSAVQEACVLPAPQFDAVAAIAIKSNWGIWRRHERQQSSWLGDVLTPDGWGDVRYVVIPREQDCALIVRQSKLRQCELFMRADWQEQWDSMGCGKLIASAHP